MNAIYHIARLTYADAIRNKIFYGVFIFLIVLLATSATLASVTMGRSEIMILDLGFGGISILGNLMAIVITIQCLQQERESRTLYILITRLHGRWQYIMGKYIGLSMVLSLQVILMCLSLALCISIFGDIYWQSFVQTCLVTILEVWIVIAIAMLFAQSSSLFLAILLSLSINVAGRFSSIIYQFGQQSGNDIISFITQIIFYILPNLATVNLRNQAGIIDSYDMAMLIQITSYAFSEIILLLLICSVIFGKKNLS